MNEKGEIMDQDLGRNGGKMEQKIHMATIENKQEWKDAWMLIDQGCLALLLSLQDVLIMLIFLCYEFSFYLVHMKNIITLCSLGHCRGGCCVPCASIGDREETGSF